MQQNSVLKSAQIGHQRKAVNFEALFQKSVFLQVFGVRHVEISVLVASASVPRVRRDTLLQFQLHEGTGLRRQGMLVMTTLGACMKLLFFTLQLHVAYFRSLSSSHVDYTTTTKYSTVVQ